MTVPGSRSVPGGASRPQGLSLPSPRTTTGPSGSRQRGCSSYCPVVWGGGGRGQKDDLCAMDGTSPQAVLSSTRQGELWCQPSRSTGLDRPAVTFQLPCNLSRGYWSYWKESSVGYEDAEASGASFV